MNLGADTRLISEFPVRLGELGEILHRRRVAVGVDARGQLVLARPDSIEVDFSGDDDRRKEVARLVDEVDGDNTDDAAWEDAEETGVLTVRLEPETRTDRWGLRRLNEELTRFHANRIAAGLNHVVFGANSVIPSLLGGALTGASAPASPPLSVITPENKAALITTAAPTTAPSMPSSAAATRRPSPSAGPRPGHGTAHRVDRWREPTGACVPAQPGSRLVARPPARRLAVEPGDRGDRRRGRAR